MTTIKLCGMDSKDRIYTLCNTIQDSLNNIINDYHKIVMKGKKNESINIEILTHSGSAPIKGWVNNGLGGYNKISDAIHKYAIDKHDYAEIHYRDNYVWHAWLKINTSHFKFHYRPNPTIKIIPELVNITTNDTVDRFKHNDFQALFLEDFNEFNTTYPRIGLLHRCLIVIRYLNEKFDYEPSFVLEMMQLQQIYYPLFHFINLFIHIVMLHKAFGRVDYFIICHNESSVFTAKTKLLKEYSILDGELVRLSEHDYNSKNHKFIKIKTGLDKIIKKYYSIIESLYIDIHSLVIEIYTTIGITIKD